MSQIYQVSYGRCKVILPAFKKRLVMFFHSFLFLLSPEPPLMSAFYSPVASLYLEAHDSANIEIHFLPFNIGERQCSIIFLNETIGEFLYSIEATATLPLPSEVPFVRTPHSVRITSAAAAGLKIFIYFHLSFCNFASLYSLD